MQNILWQIIQVCQIFKLVNSVAFKCHCEREKKIYYYTNAYAAVS